MYIISLYFQIKSEPLSSDIKQESMDTSSGITPKSEPPDTNGEDHKPSPSSTTPVASPAPQKPRQKKGKF